MTIAQLKGRAYWPSLSTDVEEYIKGCLTCARHGPAVRSQTLSPIIVSKVFQLLGFDYIRPLITTPRGKRYIFNVIEYLSRFIISYATETCSTDETITCLEDVFTKYGTPVASYTDRGGHFNNPKFQDFLHNKGIAWTPSPSGSSKSTGMIERSNGILESVLRKLCNSPGEWDTPLPLSTHNANQRIIQHLGYSPTEILLGIKSNPLPHFQAEGKLELVNTLQSGNYIENPLNHRRAVENCIAHVVELRARKAKLSKEQKGKEKEKYDRGVKNWTFKPQDLVMPHQKESGKLEPRWKGLFIVEKFAGSHGKSYKIRQIGGKIIKGTFHRDHLKEFVPRKGHLRGPSEPALPHDQTIRMPRKRRRMTERRAVVKETPTLLGG